MLGIIKRNFIYVDKSTFILLYKAMVRPRIEYAHSVWNPFLKGNIENIEKVQKRATNANYILEASYTQREVRTVETTPVKI